MKRDIEWRQLAELEAAPRGAEPDIVICGSERRIYIYCLKARLMALEVTNYCGAYCVVGITYYWKQACMRIY